MHSGCKSDVNVAIMLHGFGTYYRQVKWVNACNIRWLTIYLLFREVSCLWSPNIATCSQPLEDVIATGGVKRVDRRGCNPRHCGWGKQPHTPHSRSVASNQQDVASCLLTDTAVTLCANMPIFPPSIHNWQEKHTLHVQLPSTSSAHTIPTGSRNVVSENGHRAVHPLYAMH